MKKPTLSRDNVPHPPRLLTLPRLAVATLCTVLAAALPLAAQEKPGPATRAGKQEQGGVELFFNAEASAKMLVSPCIREPARKKIRKMTARRQSSGCGAIPWRSNWRS